MSENIYELLDRRKHQPQPQKRVTPFDNQLLGKSPLLKKQKTLGHQHQEDQNLKTPAPLTEMFDSSQISSLGINNTFLDSEVSSRPLEADTEPQFVKAEF